MLISLCQEARNRSEDEDFKITEAVYKSHLVKE